MSITQERLDELALEVAIRIGWQYPPRIKHEDQIREYARALIAAVEAELKPVAYMDDCGSIRLDTTHPHLYSKLISLPLIKEQS